MAKYLDVDLGFGIDRPVRSAVAILGLAIALLVDWCSGNYHIDTVCYAWRPENDYQYSGTSQVGLAHDVDHHCIHGARVRLPYLYDPTYSLETAGLAFSSVGRSYGPLTV